MPCWNEKLTLTASPRFSFGRSATLTPPARVSLVVRLSMFPGVGSNASPWVTALPPVYLDTSAATSGGAGISARGGGSSVGRNQPSVRFEAFRYAFATPCRLHQGLDLALAGPAEAVAEQVVRLQM